MRQLHRKTSSPHFSIVLCNRCVVDYKYGREETLMDKKDTSLRYH